MGLRDGALGLIQSRHGPFCRGLHGNRTVAVGHRIVVGVVGGREGLVGGVGDPAGSVGAIIEGQTGQPVGGDRLRDRHIQSTGSREGDLRVIPGILRGDAGIAFAGDQMIGPIHRCDLGASSVENLHRCAGGNGQRHRHGSDLLNVKGVGTLLSVGSRDLNRVILRVSGQLHRPGPGDGVILPKGSAAISSVEETVVRLYSRTVGSKSRGSLVPSAVAVSVFSVGTRVTVTS